MINEQKHFGQIPTFSPDGQGVYRMRHPNWKRDLGDASFLDQDSSCAGIQYHRGNYFQCRFSFSLLWRKNSPSSSPASGRDPADYYYRDLRPHPPFVIRKFNRHEYWNRLDLRQHLELDSRRGDICIYNNDGI